MSKELSSIYKQRKSLQGRVTKENKRAILNKINRQAENYGFQKLNSNASLNDIRNARNYYVDRMGYDVLTLAIQEGNVLTSEMVAHELKHSMDEDTKRLAEHSKELARAKQRQNSYLKNNEKDFMERGNLNIKGYGEKDIITLFENTKNKTEIKQLVNEIYNSNPKDEYYNKELDTFRKVFTRVGITREEDIDKLIAKLGSGTMENLTEKTNYLIQSLELYDSDQFDVGSHGGDETELINARLDDMLVRTGLKKGGQRAINNTYKKAKKKEK